MDRPCPSCGTPNPAAARFCMGCGASLDETLALAERRIVTILFVDLVGFTERSDRADPEDVRNSLVPYHASVKACLERFGGTLDKFIGDAVMGVFGAPIAHEDDPIRAIDASLAILDAVEELSREDPELAVRVAVNTGEAVVTFGTGPQVGEAVAGDVVNTASRLQTVAPRNGVVIGEQSERAARGRFDMEELPPATVKGKSEPLRVWRVTGQRSGDRPAEAQTSFVGRSEELDALVEGYWRVIATSASRSYVVAGEPGVGKTRMLQELEERLRVADPAPQWLATRCQPYGEDVAFRPAVRLIQAALGMSGSEDGAAITAGLERALTHAVADEEREGVRTQLQRLLGLAAGAQDPPATRDLAMAVAALIGRGGPVVVAIEDIHWAESALRELLTTLRDELKDGPVLMVATSRPSQDGELLQGATVVALGPLEEHETEGLVAELVARYGFADVRPEALAERAGGNPLYALEFVRALADRSEGGRSSTPLPDTVQAVIGARLDAVPTELRAAVLDASVIGPEFWAPAIAAVDGGDEDRARAALGALADRGVIQAGAPTWFRGLPTHRFTHALFREVAYARLPRGVRADKHLRAANWFETASADRADERADAIAHHYEQAFIFADASGEHLVAEAARGPAASWLIRAGSRIAKLDALGAFERFDRALGIAAPGTVERARALVLSSSMGARASAIESTQALRRIEEGAEIARSLDDAELTGWALVRQYSQMAFMGESGLAEPLLQEGIEALESGAPSSALAEAYAYRSENLMLAGSTGASLEWAERAIEVARDVRADNVTIMSLHLRGNARCELADAAGLDDLREALRLSEVLGSAADIVYSQSYLGEWLWLLEGPAAGLQHMDAGIELAAQRHVDRQYFWLVGGSLGPLFDAGRWTELVRRIRLIRETPVETIDPTLVCVADIWAVKLAVARGDREGLVDAEDLLGRARSIGEMHVVAPGLNAAALISLAEGDGDGVRRRLEDLETATSDVSSPTYREEVVADASRAAISVGDVILAQRFADGTGTTARARATYATARAAALEAGRGAAAAVDVYREAAERWSEFGADFERALALDALARCLAAAGNAGEAIEQRSRADELLNDMGAVRPFGYERTA